MNMLLEIARWRFQNHLERRLRIFGKVFLQVSKGPRILCIKGDFAYVGELHILPELVGDRCVRITITFADHSTFYDVSYLVLEELIRERPSIAQAIMIGAHAGLRPDEDTAEFQINTPQLFGVAGDAFAYLVRGPFTAEELNDADVSTH